MTNAVLFAGGRVFTGRRYAEALLVEGPRVVAVGSETEVRRAAPAGCERRELGSDLVVPALADAHLHLGEMTRRREAIPLALVPSVAALQQLLRTESERRPRGPLVGEGLVLESLAEQRWPSATELDDAVGDRPAILYHASGHAAVASTAALDRAYGPGLAPTAERPGEGLVLEDQLSRLAPLVREALPLTAAGLRETVRRLVRLGLACVGTMNPGAEELAMLQQLDRDGQLPLRVRVFLPAGTAAVSALPSLPPAGHCSTVGVKAFLDGAFGPRTASLSSPYSDAAPTCGVERGDDASLADLIDRAGRSGLGVALHAIGDRAVGRAVRLLSGRRPGGCPHRIEHASLTPPGLFPSLRRAGVHLAVQPGFVLSDVWLSSRLGAERCRWAYAFRSLADLGIPLAGSSDAPYDAPDPWRGMHAAVERRDELGRSANRWPGQGLSEREAFALYAGGAHRALGDPEGGRLEPGARADLLVLRARELSGAVRLGVDGVRETWVDGRPVPPIPPRPGGLG